jgi:RNA polymerase sigma-70 factor (ECF subfamily)
LSSDRELIRDSLENPQAFEVIFDRHYAAIRRYVARRLTPAHADDLAAEVFCIVAVRVEGRSPCLPPGGHHAEVVLSRAAR